MRLVTAFALLLSTTALAQSDRVDGTPAAEPEQTPAQLTERFQRESAQAALSLDQGWSLLRALKPAERAVLLQRQRQAEEALQRRSAALLPLVQSARADCEGVALHF